MTGRLLLMKRELRLEKVAAVAAGDLAAAVEAGEKGFKQPGGFMKIQSGKIVALDYTLRAENGDQIESTVGKSPLEFTYGGGTIITGLERELSGLESGDKKTVTVKPSEAYGERVPQAVRTINKEQFPKGVKLEVGASYYTKDKEGATVSFTISAIEDNTVTIDFNHPLAGKTLIFEVAIVNVKDPP
jgi:FKBP-type peptidyl-prolyl cis-trans isomerase 2